MGSREEIEKQIDELRKQLENLKKEEKEAEERKQSLKETKHESHSACEEGTSGAEVPSEGTGICTDEQQNEQEKLKLDYKEFHPWCTENFKKRKGIAVSDGLMYEVKMCCLIFLKLQRLGAKFKMCSNMDEAGDFDDIVVRYAYFKDNYLVNDTLFIQLKHSKQDKGRSICFFDHKADFDIKKLFLSSHLINSHSENDHPIFGSEPSNRFFVIYTNCYVEGKAMQRAEEDKVPSLMNELLLDKVKLTASNGRVSSTVTRTFNVYSLQHEECERILDAIHLLKYGFRKNEKHSHFVEDLNDKWIVENTKDKSTETLKKCLRKSKDFDESSYRNFSSKTFVCCSQMNMDDIDRCIKEESKVVFQITSEETERVYPELIDRFNIWRENESYFLDENCPIWASIMKNILRSRFDRRRSELMSLGVRYKQQEVTRLQKELSQGCRVYSVECSGKLTTATTLKVLQVLEYTGESYVLVPSEQYVENEELVLKTWLNKWCSTLVIEITSNCMRDDYLIKNFYKTLTKCTSRLITIFPSHNDTVAKIFQNTVLPCKSVIDSLTFNQLDRESQNRITSKKFNFQGQPVSLTDIFKTEALEKSPQDVLSRLFFDNDVTIGRDISEFEMSNYIPRYLEIPHISKDILYQNNGDVIALETITQQISTTDFRNKGKEMDILSMQRKYSFNVPESLMNVDTENYTILEHSNERSHFETLCKENTNIHWIKECNCKTETPRDEGVKVDNIYEIGNKNRIGEYNNFIWKKSKGNISTIKRSLMKLGHCCFDEQEFISHDLESPVLITGEPGIGKSCLLKNLATLIKRKFPTKWVVFVDLPQYCDFINTLKTVSEEDVDYILENSLKRSDYDVDFWKETRSNFENCVILLDAYDEMSPHYAEKVKHVMRYLNSTSCFLYIATRRSTVADLENELSVISYNVKLLNQDEGTKYFKEVMMSTSPVSEEEAYFITGQVIEKYSAAMFAGDTFLMSNPLHIKLLAEIYLDIIKDNTNIFNIYQIYSTFLEKKVVEIYKKANSDINNPAIKYQLNFFIQQFNDYNKSISAEQIFPGVKCSTMDVTTVQNEISNMCQKVGVIDEIVDGKIKFVHRSFTDYFVAIWLKENYEDHLLVLKDVIYMAEYDMIKKFYDMSLSVDLPLHSAVLSRDENRIKSLLSRGADVNGVDEMQRTPLHLAASYNHVKIAQTLLKNNADIRLRDVLDWTPIDYAIQTHSWEVVDLFLGTHNYEEKEKMEILKRIFQIWRENIKQHENPNHLFNEEEYHGTLILEKFDLLYICLSKGLKHLLENISKFIQSSNEMINLNQVIVPHRMLDIENSSNVESSKSLEYIPLHVAAESKQLEIVSQLIEKYQCDIDIVDNEGRTAFITACRSGNRNIVEYLASKAGDLDLVTYCTQGGADTHARDKHEPELFYACEGGDLDSIRYYVEQGANINSLDESRNNLLMHACSFGHLDIVKFCVENGMYIKHVNYDGANGLMMACKTGDLDIVKYCIEQGANIHDRDYKGHNLLFYACERNNLNTIRYCVEQGADINCLDKCGNNLLMNACNYGHLDIVKFCLEKGLDINYVNEDGANGLMMACQNDHLDIVKYCIQNVCGANIHTRDNRGNNLLFYACCESGNLDIIIYCVEQGADINCIDKDGDNLLICACVFGHLHIVEFCLEEGLVINDVNENGTNGLMRACKAGHLDIVKYCIQHGANIHARDNDGDNFLVYACEGGNFDIIRLLMCACFSGHLDIVKFCSEKGLAINYVNDYEANGLMIACETGDLDIVKYCIEHGANIHARDYKERNLLFFACERSNLDTICYCVEHGADIYARSLFGSDILLIAAEARYFASFEYILNFNWERGSLCKSFQIACSEYNLEFIKLLTKKCPDILCDSECLAVLFNSAYEFFFDIVEYCVEEGVDVNTTIDGTCSLLLAAVEGGHVDIVRYLVNNGASVNYIYADGYTALLVASEWGHLDIVKYLVEQGADVNHTSKKHETALMVSVENRHKNIVEYLLDQYSNILHDLHSCVCALLSACRLLQPEIAFICLDYMERKKAITSNTILFAALATMGSYFDILYTYSRHYTSLSDKNRLSYEYILYTFEESYFYMLSAYWERYCIERDRDALLKGGKIVLKHCYIR